MRYNRYDSWKNSTCEGVTLTSSSLSINAAARDMSLVRRKPTFDEGKILLRPVLTDNRDETSNRAPGYS